MLGSTDSDHLPTGVPGTSGPATRDPGASPPAAIREPAAPADPLLRTRDGMLAEVDEPDFDAAGFDVEDDPTEAIEIVVAQLAPIRSHTALASSFVREANPADPVLRAAYARVWSDLAAIIARGTTRRARIRAMTSTRRPRPRRAA